MSKKFIEGSYQTVFMKASSPVRRVYQQEGMSKLLTAGQQNHITITIAGTAGGGTRCTFCDWLLDAIFGWCLGNDYMLFFNFICIFQHYVLGLLKVQNYTTQAYIRPHPLQ